MANAIEIIQLRDTELAAQSNFRSLWQDTADLMFPRENQITVASSPGLDKMQSVYDTTAVFDSQDMASGLSNAFVPSGQLFFGLTAKDKALDSNDDVQSYLAYATEVTHNELFDSNFMLQLNETLRSLVVFGTGNLYSEWGRKRAGLNFRDWDISFYQIKENDEGVVDTMILSFPLTARQAILKFGNRAGPEVIKSVGDVKTSEKIYPFIHLVRPRTDRNISLSDNMNWPWESVFVNEKEKLTIEGGFPEFPFAAARWMKSSSEKYGRGQGTEVKPSVKTTQQMNKDLVECGNKWNNPPKEVLDHFEGTVRVTPGAINFVQEMGSIKAIQGDARGNFPISKDMLEFKQQETHRAFFTDVFAPLQGLKGDRRTQLEIIKLFEQAAGKLSNPLFRLQSELFTPTITRCVNLLIRNGKIKHPEDVGLSELSVEGFGVEYISKLALALKSSQATAFQQWAAVTGELDAIFPDERPSDNINPDKAIRRLGRAMGVNEDDMASEEEREAKRQARQQQQRQQMMMQAAMAGGKAFKDASGAPEEGSPAEALLAEA